MKVTKHFTIIGMHCVSCAMNIDGELEDTKGIEKSDTHFAKGILKVTFDDSQITETQIIEIVRGLGYKATLFDNEETRILQGLKEAKQGKGTPLPVSTS